MKTEFLPASAASKAKPHTRGFEGPSGKKMPLPAPPGCLVQVALKESLPEIPVNNKDLLMFHDYFPECLVAAPVLSTRNWQILNTQ